MDWKREIDEEEIRQPKELEEEEVPKGWRPSQETIRAIQGEVIKDEKKATEVTPQEQGRIEHYDFRARFLKSDHRNEGPKTFTTEKAITDANGKVTTDSRERIAKPDKVDYETNEIYEIKPIHKGESFEDVYFKYQDQLERYIEVYQRARDGTIPVFHLLLYKAN